MTEARAVAQGRLSAVPYVNGGMSAGVAQSNQTAQPTSAGKGFNWGNAGIGVGLAAGLLLLLLLRGPRPRQHRRSVRTA